VFEVPPLTDDPPNSSYPTTLHPLAVFSSLR
jgi:hypothetical protein